MSRLLFELSALAGRVPEGWRSDGTSSVGRYSVRLNGQGGIVNEALPEPSFDMQTQRGIWKPLDEGFDWPEPAGATAIGRAATTEPTVSTGAPFHSPSGQPDPEPSWRARETAVPFEQSGQPAERSFQALSDRYDQLMGLSDQESPRADADPPFLGAAFPARPDTPEEAKIREVLGLENTAGNFAIRGFRSAIGEDPPYSPMLGAVSPAGRMRIRTNSELGLGNAMSNWMHGGITPVHVPEGHAPFPMTAEAPYGKIQHLSFIANMRPATAHEAERLQQISKNALEEHSRGDDMPGQHSFDSLAQRYGALGFGDEPLATADADPAPARRVQTWNRPHFGEGINANSSAIQANIATLEDLDRRSREMESRMSTMADLESRFQALTGGQPITPQNIPSGQAPFPMTAEAPFGVSLQPTQPEQLKDGEEMLRDFQPDMPVLPPTEGPSPELLPAFVDRFQVTAEEAEDLKNRGVSHVGRRLLPDPEEVRRMQIERTGKVLGARSKARDADVDGGMTYDALMNRYNALMGTEVP